MGFTTLHESTTIDKDNENDNDTNNDLIANMKDIEIDLLGSLVKTCEKLHITSLRMKEQNVSSANVKKSGSKKTLYHTIILTLNTLYNVKSYFTTYSTTDVSGQDEYDDFLQRFKEVFVSLIKEGHPSFIAILLKLILNPSNTLLLEMLELEPNDIAWSFVSKRPTQMSSGCVSFKTSEEVLFLLEDVGPFAISIDTNPNNKNSFHFKFLKHLIIYLTNMSSKCLTVLMENMVVKYGNTNAQQLVTIVPVDNDKDNNTNFKSAKASHPFGYVFTLFEEAISVAFVNCKSNIFIGLCLAIHRNNRFRINDLLISYLKEQQSVNTEQSCENNINNPLMKLVNGDSATFSVVSSTLFCDPVVKRANRKIIQSFVALLTGSSF